MLYKNVSGMYLCTEVNNCLGSNYIICLHYDSCCSTGLSVLESLGDGYFLKSTNMSSNIYSFPSSSLLCSILLLLLLLLYTSMCNKVLSMGDR